MNHTAVVELSTESVAYLLHTGDGLRLEQYGLPEHLWAESSSGIFGIEVDGRRIDGRTPGLTVRDVTYPEGRAGARHAVVHLTHAEAGVEIEHHTITYSATALLETWLVVHNSAARSIRVTRLDSIAFDLPAGAYALRSFSSDWGLEFEPQDAPLHGETLLESRSGRSSKGRDPWFELERDGASMLSGAVAWSGNWAFRFTPLPEGGYQLTGGLHDWEFYADLAPGESITAPPVVLALAAGTDTNSLAQQYARVGRLHWYLHNELSQLLPVEWNHWWSYEDRAINEQAFRANVDAAARMGVEICALDAGWFGPTDPATHWYDYRGDWDLVNTVRFPSGIRAGYPE